MAPPEVPAAAVPARSTTPAAPLRARHLPAWGGWALTVAVAMPPAAALESARRVLSGSLDAVVGLTDPSTGMLLGPEGQVRATPAQLLGERWSLLWQWQPLHVPLLAGALGAVVLAALVVAGRPVALVPRAGARWAAAAVAAVSALAALAGVAGFAAQAVDVLPVGSWTASTSFLSHAAQVAVLVLAAALAAGSAFALLRARVEAEDDLPEGTGDEEADPAHDPAHVSREASPAPGPATGPAPAAAPAPAGRSEADRPEGPPRVREDDLALYRRPS
ncbi:hypothetical protein [Kineococcus sp. SYSU DK018]|uniref:hypothetical protein n=1 Tax=Kineococcus sp. SYSU DK018 TaxID=3383139 RepID=UPI003D7C5373